ncbi:MAG: riboflavin biosynthesis protein RibD [Candidatus Cloacimonadota bacterium]|nr:MAG: riboflavin biosynthesis protein RibD [Candidatus Cloacimonadota bacterium]
MNKIYMKKAMETAEKGRGKTSPNPFVGAVIVKNGNIVAEGFTQPWGQDHAEVQALKKAGENAYGADIYVTLEPCSHYGKTPPCCRAIVSAGIKNVFIGIKDPNPLVSGKGIEYLKNAGVNVKCGILAEKISRQLEFFLTFIKEKRPFVMMKNAVSLDGNIASANGESKWITSEETRKKVHILRSQYDVLLTGIGTVSADNPMLNDRVSENPNQPVRAVLDTNLRLPRDSKIAQTANEQPVWVFTKSTDKTAITELEKLGIRVIAQKNTNEKISIKEVLSYIYEQNLYSVMAEAGPGINSALLDQNLIDKFHYFIGGKIIGGSNSVFGKSAIYSMQQSVSFDIREINKIGSDIEIIAYKK